MIPRGFSQYLCLLAMLLVFSGSEIGAVDRGYIFTAPKKFLAGETESGCLSLHNLEPPAHVLLELLSPASVNDEEVLASTSTLLDSGVETCLELAVPDRVQMTYTMARLRLKIRFDKYPEYHVNTEKEVYIEYDSVIMFAETDKPVYKPGQDVNIRLLALTHDLKPWKRQIPKVWIENPSEVRVAQWTNLSTDRGIVQLLFPLSPEPSPGTWRIKVEKKKSHPQLTHTSTFEVRKYVLPRFQVTIKGPSYILADADNATWSICARYSYGEPVRGSLRLKSSPQTPSWRRKHNFPAINYETRIESPDGCAEPFTITSSGMGLPHWEVAPNSIVLTANLTEDGTEVVETATSRTVVVHQALKLEFLPHTPKYFKLGLPYHGKLRVLKQDETPAPGEKIQLCLRVRGKDEWVRVVVECRNFTSSPLGFVNFIVPSQHKNIVLLSFVATGIEYSTKYYSPDKRWRVFMDQPSAYIDVGAWYSPSDSYLAVARGDQPIVCGEKYPFNVMYTMPNEMNGSRNDSVAFHYSINSKGDLLIFGHVRHKPHRDSVLNYSDFKNVLGAVETTTTPASSNYHQSHHHSNVTRNEPMAHTVHRFPLSVKVTPSMAPISELLLYYVRPDGETVATTYTIEVGHCFENRVKTHWQEDTQSPGEAARYHVEAAPWSLCGISVVDQSTSYLSDIKKSLVDADEAFEQAKRFHLNRDTPILYQSVWSHCKKTNQPETSIEEIDPLPSPAVEVPPVWDLRAAPKQPWNRQLHREGRQKRSVIHNGGVNYVDAMQAFDDFGVIVMSDLILESRPCPQNQWIRSRENIDFEMMRTRMDEPDRMWGTVRMMPQAFPLLNFAVVDSSAPGPDLGYADQLPDHILKAPRSYFPETWLWDLVATGKEGRAVVKRNLPHTITNWIGHTICISSNYGLGIAQPVQINAFQPFFLDYSIPYSVKRGELLRMRVSLFNYMQHNLPVKIQLVNAPGFDLHLSNSTGKYCVEARKSVVHEYVLRPRVIGEINVTVSAAVDPDFDKPCGPNTVVFTQDAIVKPILVLPEGFPIETTKSAFVCPKDFSDDSSISWNLDLPDDFVADSVRAYVSLVGDLLGPALENLDNLVRLPFGCGEQNLILFAPNIQAIAYLDATRRSSVSPELRKKAIRNMEKGYQRELNYRHPDGSYSAFGPHSSESGGSMWLTAFVVKSFAQARNYIHIDERDLKLSVKWIIKKQLENGCFPLIGRVFHKDMKGGLQDENQSFPAALTAYVLVSLLESGKSLPPSIISNALFCLEKGMPDEADGNPYTAALATYALTLLEHPNANASMKSLLSRSTRLHDLMWWEDKNKPSMGLSIEMTAYAVLSLVKLGGEANMALALKAVRWMSKQRNAEGGFTSTQDTVLGLEALAKYAAAMSSNYTDLSVLVTAGDVAKVVRIHEDNRMVLVQVRLPVLPTLVEIFAEGEGCVLVQTNLKYNVARATGSQAFDLVVNTEPVASGDECSMQKISVCVRYKMADEESNMALLEIGMISGFIPDKGTLHALLEEPSTRVKRFEEERDSVTMYFDKLTGERTCISFLVTRENIVEKAEPAIIKLYDYYRQELTFVKSYTFAKTCGIRDVDIEGLDSQPNDPEPTPLFNLEVPIEKEITSLQRSAKDLPQDAILAQTADEAGDKAKQTANETSYPSLPPPAVKKLMTILHEVLQKNTTQTLNSSTVERIPMTFATSTTTESIESIDEVDLVKHIEPGSGLEPEQSAGQFFDNPSFVVIDHELNTPDGIEGPPPVYVKPPSNFQLHQEDREHPKFFTPQNETENNRSGNLNEDFNNSPLNQSVVSTSCPLCGDKLPLDIKDLYCKSSAAVKVAIRRLRKARLLLDLRSEPQPKRLRFMIELSMNENCTCPALDKPGSLALIFATGNSTSPITDSVAYDHNRLGGIGEYVKKPLDGMVSIYTLPNTGYSSSQIIEAREFCPTSPNT
ncbi:alpha-2-macroglobulin-like [Diachasma alloeum]|uniref:alpha-2-macroglobulin-like n=1 Tax=Diachasma alloeum TaxID=454923 RepID=UPI0007383BA5|nr:alpha-2-macroglobulin-like [Diachasma alloeum]